MEVDRGGGGFERAHAVVVVRGVEELHVEDAADTGNAVAGEAHGASGDGVLEGFGPAVGAGDDLHAVGAQRVQLADVAVDGDGFDVAVAGDEQVAEQRLEELGADLDRVRAVDEVEQRMDRDLFLAAIEKERHRGGGLGGHAHAAVDDRVAHEAFAGEGGVVTRCPGGLAQRLERDQRAGGTGFRLGRRDGRRRWSFARTWLRQPGDRGGRRARSQHEWGSFRASVWLGCAGSSA